MPLLLGNRPTSRRINPGQLQLLPRLPVPAGEAARLAALQRYQILDTSPAQAFGQIVRSAADTANVPVALISLVDRHRQWFLAAAGLAKIGVTVRETPRDVAFCAHTIMGDGLLEVEDATRDDRFRNNPLVTGPVSIRFYAGMPLLTHEGHAVGTLCLIDRQPRRLDPVAALALPLLARQVVDQLELRLVQHHLHEAKRALTTIANHYSHGVRLPLASLLGILGLIDPNTLAGENRELYEMLCETARNMDDTIHQVVHTANGVTYQLPMTND